MLRMMTAARKSSDLLYKLGYNSLFTVHVVLQIWLDIVVRDN